MKMHKGLAVVLKLILSGLLLFFLYQSTPVAEIITLFAGIDLRYLPFIFALLFCNTVLSALKWRILLRADSINISLFDLTVSYLIGTFFNIFLPSSIGGDSYRIYDVARRSREAARSAASVLADRLSGFLALILLSLLSSFPVAHRIGQPCFFLLPLVLALGLSLVLWGLFRKTPAIRLLSLLHLDRYEAVTGFVDRFFSAWQQYHRRPRILALVMLLSFTFQLSVILTVYLMACALGASVSPIYFAAFVPVINLMEALPISIYGLGVRDAGYVLFFGLAGMTDIQTRALSMFFLAVTVCYSLFGGLVFFLRNLITKYRQSGTGEQGQGG